MKSSALTLHVPARYLYNVDLVFLFGNMFLTYRKKKTFSSEMNVDVTNIPNNKKYLNGSLIIMHTFEQVV